MNTHSFHYVPSTARLINKDSLENFDDIQDEIGEFNNEGKAIVFNKTTRSHSLKKLGSSPLQHSNANNSNHNYPSKHDIVNNKLDIKSSFNKNATKTSLSNENFLNQATTKTLQQRRDLPLQSLDKNQNHQQLDLTKENTNSFTKADANNSNAYRLRTNSHVEKLNANLIDDATLNNNRKKNVKSTSSIKRLFSTGKQNIQHPTSNHHNKHELTFRFKKKRSLSHSYTTGYDIYTDKINDEEDDEDDDDENENDEDDDYEENIVHEDELELKKSHTDISSSKLNYFNINTNSHLNKSNTSRMLEFSKTNSTANNNVTSTNHLGSIASTSNESSSISSSSKASSSSSDISTANALLTNSLNLTTNKMTQLTSQQNMTDSHKTVIHINKLPTNNNKIYLKNNNNNNGNTVIEYKKNLDDDLNVIVLDGTEKMSGKQQVSGTLKRVDSIRMRHYSNVNANSNTNENDRTLNNESSTGKARMFRLWKRNNSSRQKRHNFLIIFLLFVVNLLNYIDRFTLAGVLPEIQKYFNINDGESGLLQTVFICSYMLLAPLFGYLGDRYSRKWIVIFGISFWSLMTLLGSFVPADKFWMFAIIRSLVGIGEASYSCVAPTIIGDLFTSEMRTRMLALFYLAVPVGSGMGYIVGSNVASAFGNWQWSLRITPPLGLACIILLVLVFKDPKRGGAEGSIVEESSSSILDDVLYLMKNKTFIWITFGFTFASFVLGGLSWWVPTFVQYAILSKGQTPDQVPLKFGVVTCISGLIGVALSSVLASKLRTITKHADPLVCALGSFIAVPTLFILILITRSANQYFFWFLTAIAITAMCLSWTIVADVLLYAIHPSKRSIASALNILICHLFGDAGSPYVIGLISDALRAGKPDTYYNKFTSLQLALYAGPFFAALSFAAYLFAAIYVAEDKQKVDELIRKNQKSLVDSAQPSVQQLSSSNEITSTENSQKEDDDDDINNGANKPTILNEVADNEAAGTTNLNFTDSKTDMDSTNSDANLIDSKKN